MRSVGQASRKLTFAFGIAAAIGFEPDRPWLPK